MSRRLGRQAQDEFKSLCSQALVTCNKSDEDDHGWDFIVEIEPKQTSDQPADKEPGIKKALIQVKSTTGKSQKTKIKVSNALKFAKDELPCFVVLFHYKVVGERRIYVRHFWTELIERALLRGRKASDKNIETHKAIMEIGFCEQDEHTNDLISWIIDAVRSASAEYSSEKRSLCESLGYENGKYLMEVTFGAIGGIEDIVDHELGLSDYLPVSKVRVVDSRFGIDLPVDLGSDLGRIQIRPNSNRKCNTVIQIDDGDVVSLEGLMKTPGIPNLPADKFKLVVDTWCFTSIVSADGKLSFKFKDLWNEKLPIDNAFKIMKLLSWSGQEITIKFAGEDVPPLSFTGQIFSTPHVGLFSEMSAITETLHNIQMRAGHTQARLSFTDLHRCFRELSFVTKILTAEDMQLRFEWDSALRSDLSLSEILGYFSLQIGEFHYFVLFDASVTDNSNQEDGVMLNCGRRVLRDCLVGSDRHSVESTARESYEREADHRGDECLGIGDLRALLGG